MERKKEKSIKVYTDSVLLFPLGKLGGYEAAKFLKQPEFEKTDRFILTLCHAFNDLKDIFLWLEINREFAAPTPEEGKVDRHFGQACGIDNHLFRLMCGWLNEFCELLKHQKEALSDDFFKSTVAKVDKDCADQWDSLCKLAIAGKEELAGDVELLRKYLVKVRNNGTFHYYQTEPLAKGFEAHFAEDGAQSKLAYATYGSNLEETRFLFADASATALCANFSGERLADLQKLMSRYLRSAHRSIYFIVTKYLNKRGFAYKIVE